MGDKNFVKFHWGVNLFPIHTGVRKIFVRVRNVSRISFGQHLGAPPCTPVHLDALQCTSPLCNLVHPGRANEPGCTIAFLLSVFLRVGDPHVLGPQNNDVKYPSLTIKGIPRNTPFSLRKFEISEGRFRIRKEFDGTKTFMATILGDEIALRRQIFDVFRAIFDGNILIL